MRDHTASSLFLIQKKVESVLHRCFPNWWVPLYTMVAFTRTSYDEAYRKGKLQDKALHNLGYGVLGVGVLGALSMGASMFLRSNNR